MKYLVSFPPEVRHTDEWSAVESTFNPEEIYEGAGKLHAKIETNLDIDAIKEQLRCPSVEIKALEVDYSAIWSKIKELFGK